MEPNTQNTTAPLSDAENNINTGSQTTSPTISSSATSSMGGSSVPLPKNGSPYFNNSIFWIEV
ncbi:MAG: hypothetical protein KBC87_02875, partial [Candidatus Pacebacteria bacterium]|nr:hypothetical protein [Candidatus Paceibacterota bacterium]